MRGPRGGEEEEEVEEPRGYDGAHVGCRKWILVANLAITDQISNVANVWEATDWSGRARCQPGGVTIGTGGPRLRVTSKGWCEGMGTALKGRGCPET